ncbi:hypothetical protein [Terricaulis sp.]|uniref:hypothetical protein n=1 Tax=Terricaulis sp. TaxID=2768686 RepID=UPI0037847DEE
MLRSMIVLLALATLGGCASLGLDRPANTAVTSFDACAERSPFAAPCPARQRSLFVAAQALDRRAFSLPTRRAPEQMPIFATATDYSVRLRRQWRRRRYRKL